MKKILPICLSIIMVSIPTISYLITKDSTMELPFVDKIGNRSAIEDVHWQSNYYIDTYQYQITMEQGVATSRAASNKQSESTSTFPVAVRQKTIVEEKTASNPGQVTNGRCSVHVEDVDKASISYQLRYMGIAKAIIIHTPLEEVSNDVFQIRKTTSICDYESNTTTIDEVYRDPEVVWRGSFLNYQGAVMNELETKESIAFEVEQEVVKVSDEEYYFLPYGDAYTEGKTILYRIRLSNMVNQLYQEYQVEEVATLQEGRIYEKMQLVQGNLVVFSHDDTKIYFETFGLDGTLRSETNFAYSTKQQGVYVQLFTYDQYVIMSDGYQIYVVDSKDSSKKLESTYQDDKIIAIAYENQRVYVVSSGKREDQTVFTVIQDQQVEYQGSIQVSQNEKSAFQEFAWGYESQLQLR